VLPLEEWRAASFVAWAEEPVEILARAALLAILVLAKERRGNIAVPQPCDDQGAARAKTKSGATRRALARISTGS